MNFSPRVVRDFAGLFRGRTDAYGTDEGGVVMAPLDDAHYELHLVGARALGVFPLTDDGTVRFAAIDLDEPNFELARAMRPLIPNASFVERSRSGNAHIWVFFSEPTPAWAVRTVLRAATESVGRRDVEVFPKQDRVRPGGVGNYINLPYFGATLRPMLDEQGKTMDLGRFLELAQPRRQAPGPWIGRARRLGGAPPEEREASSTFGEQASLHECALYIIQGALDGDRPIKPGHRHNVLFHLSKMLLNYRDFDDDEAWDYVRQVNASMPRPLPDWEVLRAFSNARRGEYTSTGCDDPVMAPYVRPDCPIANG